jgi:hypothetical protein
MGTKLSTWWLLVVAVEVVSMVQVVQVVTEQILDML